jgi:hypothetical protein
MMNIKKLKDTLTDEGEKADFQDSQQDITEPAKELHLLVIALDPAIPMELKSVTFHFENRDEGLQAFDVLAATARNVYKTCVEDTRQDRTVRRQMHLYK